MVHSGVQATIAGVILARTIPSRTQLNVPEFLHQIQTIVGHLDHCADREKSPLNDEEQQVAIDALEDACEKAQPLLFRFNEALHPWVTFLTMPALALANAGVVLSGDLASRAAEPVTLGVAIGLLLGKPIGITLLS